MIVITRSHTIDAGHRVFGHEGKCANLHGHRYKFDFVLYSKTGELDSVGRIIDFSRIKSILCDWLEIHWDHKLLMFREDPLAMVIKLEKHWHSSDAVVLLPVNPTAENLVKYLVEDIVLGLLLGTGIELLELTLWETDKCSATYRNYAIMFDIERMNDAESTIRRG